MTGSDRSANLPLRINRLGRLKQGLVLAYETDGGSLRKDRLAWLLACLVLVIGLLFVAIDLVYNRGHLSAAIDDTYITMQYSKNFASGHFFEIYPGYGVTSGASSLLYMVFLGVAYTVGFHGTSLLVVAILSAVIFWALTAALVCQVGTILVSRSVGVAAGLFVALDGSLAWATGTGMEVGLAMFLIMGTLRILVHEMPARRYVWTPVVAGLLALTRPECAIFAVCLSGAQIWSLWSDRLDMGRRRALRLALWSLLPLVLFLAELVFYRIATGTASSSALQAKSLLYVQPVFFFWPFVDALFQNVQTYFGFFNGTTSLLYEFPGAVFVFGAGLAFALIRRPYWRGLWVAVGVGLTGMLLLVCSLQQATVQNLRYVQPFTPVFLLLTATGIYAITRVIRDPQTRALAMPSLVAIPLVFALILLPNWFVGFGRDTRSATVTNIRVAKWIDANLPPHAIVAVRDLGAVAYYSNHPVVDMVGLGTAGFAIPFDQGIGSLYEQLSHMPVDRRPAYVVTYDGNSGSSTLVTEQPLESLGFFRSPALATLPVELPDAQQVPFTSESVFKLNWRVVALSAGRPVRGQLRDHITIGYLASEKAHDYTPLPAEEAIEPFTTVARNGDEIDSGRTILGGEAFTVKNLVPHKPLIITSHTYVEPGSAPRLQVLADGSVAGTLPLKPERTGVIWSTLSVTVPARLVRSREVHIELRPPPGFSQLNPYPDYISYGYWFSQQ